MTNPSIFALPGYKFLSQPSRFKVGGVALFIDDGLSFSLRDDLSSSTDESLWIELQNDGGKNILCGGL